MLDDDVIHVCVCCVGKFTISGIERAKKGEAKVDVSFSLDSNGILNVEANDQKTGATAKITIASRGRCVLV